MLEIFFYYRISPPPNLPLSENYTKTVQHKEGNNVIVKASGTKEKRIKMQRFSTIHAALLCDIIGFLCLLACVGVIKSFPSLRDLILGFNVIHVWIIILIVSLQQIYSKNYNLIKNQLAIDDGSLRVLISNYTAHSSDFIIC